MNLDIAPETYEAILEQIQSADSPVGIDAGKTHVIILHKLLEIERRLDLIEEKLDS